MNRRTFLTGLLSTAAAVSTAAPVAAVVPRALSNEEILALFEQRVRDALDIMCRNLEQNVFGLWVASQSGGLAEFVYRTDEEPVRYQHAEFGVDVAFSKEPC